MDLALADAELLKPEIQLAQALRDYETILSDEDNNQLTTLINRNCGSRRNQCLGPRLITFLESVQQFYQVVDTLVSSHPEFAALVWGGVKLALLVSLPPGL